MDVHVLLRVFLCVYYLNGAFGFLQLNALCLVCLIILSDPKHRLALPCTPGIQVGCRRSVSVRGDGGGVGSLSVAAATSLAAGGSSSSFGELAEATGAAPATGPQLNLPQWRHQSVAEPILVDPSVVCKKNLDAYLTY